jgi:flagellar hook assembly protein FlgD
VGDDGSDGSVPGRPPYESFDLSCHPNPCNPAATIDFSLASSRHANLAIYDARGGLVRTLVNGTLAGGPHSIVWNGTNESGTRVASGVYFYRIATGKKSETKKILLLR